MVVVLLQNHDILRSGIYLWEVQTPFLKQGNYDKIITGSKVFVIKTLHEISITM